MAAGFTGMHARQDITNQLLWLHAQQHETMICLLEKISRNTCALLNEAARQTPLQQEMAEATRSLDHMFATVHPEGALEYRREEEQRKAVERCCPPESPKPPCTYEECPAPRAAEPPRPPRYEGYTPPPSQVGRREPIG
jgi:hypothetical protein